MSNNNKSSSSSSDYSNLMNAATIVCIRRNVRHVSGGFEVLLGQNECKNWLRSTPQRDVIMRYPGEWKFPGGVVEEQDVSFKHTALRELHEEFIGIQVPPTVVENDTILFNTKITRPIKNKRYRMYNFVTLVEDETADWISDDAISHINEQLCKKRQNFESMLSDGSYWTKTNEEKQLISPEVRRVAWYTLEDAIKMMDDDTPFVDEWQQLAFAEFGITARDPMHVTAESLAEVRDHKDMAALRASAELYAEKSTDIC